MLTQTEKTILHHLSRAKSYLFIRQTLGISAEALHTACCRIRRKTGIQNTRDPQQCRQWERDQKTSVVQKERGPSPKERETLWLLSKGMSNQQIAQLRNVKPATVMTQAYLGRQRAGIRDLSRASLAAWFQQDEQKREAAQKEVFRSWGHLNGDPCF